MNDRKNKGCGCAGGGPVARIVKGNDFTVVALASVYDEEKGLYIPFGLAEATDVELNIVGIYGKVSGKDVAVDGNSVSTRFSGAIGVGPYGVEILFRDSEGKGRIFERNLFEIVATSGEATAGSTAEGETGDGYNISVDVRARTVRIGKSTGVTDYTLLDNKPSINGHTLEGDKSLEDLDIPSKETVDISLSSKREIYKLSREEALALVEPMEEDEGEYQRLLPAALSNLVDKVIKVEHLTLEFPINYEVSTDKDSLLGGYTTLEAACQHLIESDAEGYYINIIGYSFREEIKAFRRVILKVTAPTENAYSIIISPATETPFFSVADWEIANPSKPGYIKNKPKIPAKLSDLSDDKVIIIVTGVARSNSKSATISKGLFDTAYNAISTDDYKNNNIVIKFKGQSIGNYGEIYSNVLFGRNQITSGENTVTTDIVFYCLDNFNPSSGDHIDSDPDWRIHLHYRRIIFRAIRDDSSKNMTYSLIQEEMGNVLTDTSTLDWGKVINKPGLVYSVTSENNPDLYVLMQRCLTLMASQTLKTGYRVNFPNFSNIEYIEKIKDLPQILYCSNPEGTNRGLFIWQSPLDGQIELYCWLGYYGGGNVVVSNFGVWNWSKSNPTMFRVSLRNYQVDWNAASNSIQGILNKPTIFVPTKSGDGTKFLNDKGEYADPVAGVKSSVEALAPYDCSWLFKLTSGTEITQSQWNELEELINSGRTLFAHYKERTASVIGIEDNHSDTYNYLRFILFDDWGEGWRCLITDNVDEESHYAEIFVSSWELQRRLVPGTNIKTVNGQSLLGAGDIALPVPTKVSELANDAGYAKADVLETITDASEVSVTCEAGRIRQGNNIMTLAVGCSATDNSQPVEERIVFSTGSSVESITVTGVSWANGDTPSFKGNKVYEISISYIPLLGKFLATYAEY